MLLEVRGVSKGFGGRNIIDDLSLTARDGEILVLLGPSGSGKTTLLNLVAGLIAPDKGEIVMDGRVASSRTQLLNPRERGVGLVFQNYALWPHMTVFENIAFPLRVRGVSGETVRTKVEDMLKFVSLTVDVRRHPPQSVGRRGPKGRPGEGARSEPEDTATRRTPLQP